MTLTRARVKALEMARVENFEHGQPPMAYSLNKHVKMDSSLWSALPEHLVERVLARLPLSSFFRFRSVCKTWNNLMHSTTFLQAYAEVPSQEPWFLMFTDDDYRDGSTYDPTLNKWHHIPLPTLPCDEVFFPAAAAGGLVCLGCYDDGWKKICGVQPFDKEVERTASHAQSSLPLVHGGHGCGQRNQSLQGSCSGNVRNIRDL